MRCAALTALIDFCEDSAEIPFDCLRDRGPGKAAVIESERLSAAGSMSGMALAGVSQGHAPGCSMGADAPSVRSESEYHMKTLGVSKILIQ